MPRQVAWGAAAVAQYIEQLQVARARSAYNIQYLRHEVEMLRAR